MADALDSFRGKRVFITGHTGFKGAWLTYLLTMLGADVKGFSLAPLTSQSHFEQLALHQLIRHVEGDVRDADSIKQEIQSFAPEYVFHLAAQALVRRSYLDPVETLSTNVIGAVHLLEAVRATPSVRSLVFITSDKCYENREWIWGYRENDRLGGHDPYSASKAAAEMVFSAYWNSFFSKREEFGGVTTRAGNVIGGGDLSADRIIPDCVRAILEDRPVFLRNPNATRPWQHVLEPLSGYLLLAANLYNNPSEFSGAWNFGPSSTQCLTVGEVAKFIVSRFQRGEIVIPDNLADMHEAQLLQLNCDKANLLLGWYSRWDVYKTLVSTADWYQALMLGEDAKVVTGRQIREYFPEIL
jgi:CDP-glucose 4,6-dehydratase